MFTSTKDVDSAKLEDLEAIVAEGDMQSILSKQLFTEYITAHKIIQNIEDLTECIAFAIKKKVEQQSEIEDIDSLVAEFMDNVAFDLNREYDPTSDYFLDNDYV